MAASAAMLTDTSASTRFRKLGDLNTPDPRPVHWSLVDSPQR